MQIIEKPGIIFIPKHKADCNYQKGDRHMHDVIRKPFLSRIISFMLGSIMFVGCFINPETADFIVHALDENLPIDQDSSYEMNLRWRNDDNTNFSGYDYEKEDSSNTMRYIFLGIEINNKTLTPIYPGEFALTFSGLNGLSRSSAQQEQPYKFDETDSVFSQNWKIVNYNAETDEYTIVNKTELSNKRLSTLFYAINSRDAVATEHSDAVNNDGTVTYPFERTVTSNYKITRFLRNNDGN